MAGILEKAKKALASVFDTIGSSKIEHKIDFKKDGNMIWMELDVSGHIMTERLPLDILKMSESRAMVYIEEATLKLCKKAGKAGLLTND